jgi:hypothetical protein
MKTGSGKPSPHPKLAGIKLDLFGESDPRRMPEYLFFGARHLDYESAQRANVKKQNYTVCPRHWYVNATFGCKNCGKEFVFSAIEQRFWYEDRNFWIDSTPKRCVTCRKTDRTKIALKKQYDDTIQAALGSSNVEAKREALQIIDEIEAVEDSIPEQMKQKRERLRKQLAKFLDAT